ncbi:hypothetical protein OH77DRAFT_1196092 [Trametes cingulata]|nr:hypothetical protein OH77DRAFT_1196092 [Trametes cingulata]
MNYIDDCREFLQLGDDTVHAVKAVAPALKLLNHFFPSYHISRGEHYQEQILELLELHADCIRPAEVEQIIQSFDQLESTRKHIVDHPPLQRDECRNWKKDVKVLKETASVAFRQGSQNSPYTAKGASHNYALGVDSSVSPMLSIFAS